MADEEALFGLDEDEAPMAKQYVCVYGFLGPDTWFVTTRDVLRICYPVAAKLLSDDETLPVQTIQWQSTGEADVVVTFEEARVYAECVYAAHFVPKVDLAALFVPSLADFALKNAPAALTPELMQQLPNYCPRTRLSIRASPVTSPWPTLIELESSPTAQTLKHC